MHWIVFTDLDGSLLNEEDYRYDAARPALDRLRRLGGRLVLVTSKTRAEVEPLAVELGTGAPYVVENGGGIFVPPGNPEVEGGHDVGDGLRCIVLGRPHAELRTFLEAARRRWSLRGFTDMSVAEVAARCGLPLDAAQRARRREFSEPFVIEDPAAVTPLAEAAHARGLQVTRGGRFHHLIAAGQDKGVAVRHLLAAYGASRRAPCRSVGVGDSPNDREMLEATDVAVVIPRPDGRHLAVSAPDVVRARRSGAAGWNEALLSVLERP